MAAVTCPSTADVQRFLNGQIREAEAVGFEAHLERCDRCLAVLQQLKPNDGLAEAVRQGARSGATLESPLIDELVQRISGLVPCVARETDPTVGLTNPDAAGPAAELADLLAPPQQPEEIGRLAQYRVLKKLGEGGMGVVFLAEDPQLQRQVALKVMKAEQARNPAAHERFLREARAMAKVKNDHIVTVYAVGQHGEVPFMAMELLEGEPLDRWLSRGKRPTVAQVLRLGRDIARGLAAAHAKGLVHRDIKPANLWLEAPQGRIKLLDFGLARPGGDPTQLSHSGVIMGTPAYMSPEQARGRASPSSDLFSLGCVLYRLLTGELPFKGGDTMSMLAAIALDTPRPIAERNPNVPPALDGLVMKLLEKDPAKRPPSAQAVVEALRGIEQHLSGAATAVQTAVAVAPPEPPTLAEPLPRTPPPRRSMKGRLVALGGGVLVAAILGGVLLVLAGNPGPKPEDTNLLNVPTASGEAPPLAVAPFDAAQARAHQEGWARHLGMGVEITNTVGLKLRLVPPGRYQQGTTPEVIQQLEEWIRRERLPGWVEERPQTEGPRREVTLARAWYCGVHEVTQEQYQKVMGKNPSKFTEPSHPVENVSYFDAIDFCVKLSELEGRSPCYKRDDLEVVRLPGDGYRLPTEAEWEFVCRAGTTTLWHFGDDVREYGKYAQHTGVAGVKTFPVGGLLPNPFGVFDLYGNVTEWCQDQYDLNYPEGDVTDPEGPTDFPFEMDGMRTVAVRGGGVRDSPLTYRSAGRGPEPLTFRGEQNGFRVVRGIQPSPRK